ncbi:hypothetical protein BEWA_026360 [Theileria equi strain WA]|uniref:RSE1/DDB1/CPSF1 C-terminal domain-containing protein n=1 Tax=Theileria equi strain WA TaxID=1537102 RepID=L0AW07_THEEQ|nr:hypothetical protein BEWA_026360 [Theileria equi strain WA]AFZ79787.1 hypothetical protein BEWA_026360 [Theileria equi strain WA]|eukprot:XP_004829453.1 hypothetical protein BEWA_026360 [Theileria equi strain WA]
MSLVRLAYHTIAESTEADFILYGNFILPDSRDVLIVKDRKILLYTLVSKNKHQGATKETSPKIKTQEESNNATSGPESNDKGSSCTNTESKEPKKGGKTTQKGTKRKRNQQTVQDDTEAPKGSKDVESTESNTEKKEDVEKDERDSAIFVCQFSFFGAPVAVKILKDAVFHEYQAYEEVKVGSGSKTTNASSTESTTKKGGKKATKKAKQAEYVQKYKEGLLNTEDTLEHKEKILATSALILVFESGHVVTCAYDRFENTFVTLSMHILAENEEDTGDFSAVSRGNLVTDTFISIHVGNEWSLQNVHTASSSDPPSECRLGTFCRQFIIAICYDGRVINIFSLQTQFTRPLNIKSFKQPEIFKTIPVDSTERKHIALVPWLQISKFYTIDVDYKFGLCDNTYFVRGLDFSTDVFCILIATSSETIATHETLDDTDIIGGMSLVCLNFDVHTMQYNVIHRVDALPLDIQGIHAYNYKDATISYLKSSGGTNGIESSKICDVCTPFVYNRDTIIWFNTFETAVYWQFLSPTAFLAPNVCEHANLRNKYVYRDSTHLRIDLDDYHFCNFTLIPKSGGHLYVGRPIIHAKRGMIDIVWEKFGEVEHPISTCIETEVGFVASGNGIELSIYTHERREFTLVSMDPSAVQEENSVELAKVGASEENDSEVKNILPGKLQHIYTVNLPDIPLSITFSTTPEGQKLKNSFTNVSPVTCKFLLENIGILKEVKNTTLAEHSTLEDFLSSETTQTPNVTSTVPDTPAKVKRRRKKVYTLPYEKQLEELRKLDVTRGRQALVGVSGQYLTVLLEKVPLLVLYKMKIESGARIIGFGEKCLLTWESGSSIIDVHAPTKKIESDQVIPLDTSLSTVAYGILKNGTFCQVTPEAILLTKDGKSKSHNAKSTIFQAHFIDSSIVCLSYDQKLVVYKVEKLGLSVHVEYTNVVSCGVYIPTRLGSVWKDSFTFVQNDSLYCVELVSLKHVVTLHNLLNVDEILDNDHKESEDADGVVKEEAIISATLVDVSVEDIGPTLLLFITGRPLIVYRSFFVDESIRFKLHLHKFVTPIPSSLHVGETRVNCTYRCAYNPVHISRNSSKQSSDHITIVYPYCTPKDMVIESNEMENEAHSSIFERRWNQFVPPMLRLSSVLNRLYIHKYDTPSGITSAYTLSSLVLMTTTDGNIVVSRNENEQTDFLVTLNGGIKRSGSEQTSVSTSDKDIYMEDVSANAESKDVTVESPQEEPVTANTDQNDKGSTEDKENSAPVNPFFDPQFCTIVNNQDEIKLHIKGDSERLIFNGELISKRFKLKEREATITAVSGRDYLLQNGRIIHQGGTSKESQGGLSGKLFAVVVKRRMNAKRELMNILDHRFRLQFKHIALDPIYSGANPMEKIEANRELELFLQTYQVLDWKIDQNGHITGKVDTESITSTGLSGEEYRDYVLLFHMGDLSFWYAEYELEAYEVVLSMTFGVIDNVEYLLIGTCTSLGEHIETKGEVIILSLSSNSLYTKPLIKTEDAVREGDTDEVICNPAQKCHKMDIYCKRRFSGPITFLSALNSDFDVLFGAQFDFLSDLESAEASQNKKWILNHFMPNSNHFVHSVGSNIFVHEITNKTFVRGAFAETPICISSGCIFNKFIILGDIFKGVYFYMYCHDVSSDSRSICKIASTSPKAALSIVACAPLVNQESIAILASDFDGNLLVFSHNHDENHRDKLNVESAVRLENRVVQFVRRETNAGKLGEPIGVFGWTASGSLIKAFMPDYKNFQLFKMLENALDSVTIKPLGIMHQTFSSPALRPQMQQTQLTWPTEADILVLDILDTLPFQPASVIHDVMSKISAEDISVYGVLKLMDSTLFSL